MYIYKIREGFIGRDIIFPGKGFIRLTYETPIEKLEKLYNMKHPAVTRKIKKEKVEDKKEEAVDDKQDTNK